MAARLYGTTRPRFAQVVAAAQVLGVPVAVAGHPTAIERIARYVTGVVRLAAWPPPPRSSAPRPARRLPRVAPARGTRPPTRRPPLGVRAIPRLGAAPSVGPVRLVVRQHEHGNVLQHERGPYDYLGTNALTGDRARRGHRPRSRWRSNTRCHDPQHLAGLATGPGWGDRALVRHVALVGLAGVGLPVHRPAPQATAGAGTARWPGEVLRDGQTPPPPLRATPPLHPSATAGNRVTPVSMFAVLHGPHLRMRVTDAYGANLEGRQTANIEACELRPRTYPNVLH